MKPKLQAPTSSIKRSSKHQSSSSDALVFFWILEVEVSLELGAWNLELFP
jgi:hypothetical protein